MVARDEGRIDASHRLSAFARIASLAHEPRPPGPGPCVIGFGPGKQGADLGVRLLVFGGGAKPAERQREVGAAGVHRFEELEDEVAIAILGAFETELAAHAREPMGREAAGKRRDGLARKLDRPVEVRVDQREQGLREPRQIPGPDRRLIGVGIAPGCGRSR